jgi:hypothetical protein
MVSFDQLIAMLKVSALVASCFCDGIPVIFLENWGR